MRRLLVVLAVFLGACGSSGGDASPTTTTEATTTQPASVLSLDGQRAVILCVEAQGDYASSLAFGQSDEAAKQNADDKCTEAYAYIDTEAPSGPNVARSIAARIAENNADLSVWAIGVQLGNEIDATDALEGVAPLDASLVWRGEIDALLDQL